MLLTLRDFGIEDKKIINLPVPDNKRKNRYVQYIRTDSANENAFYLTNLCMNVWLNSKKMLTGYVAIVIYNPDGSFYLGHNAEMGVPDYLILEQKEPDYYRTSPTFKDLGYRDNLDFLSHYLPDLEHIEAYGVFQQILSEAGTQRFRTVHLKPSDRIWEGTHRV